MTTRTERNSTRPDETAGRAKTEYCTGPPQGPSASPEFEAWRDGMIARIVAQATPLDERQLNRLVSQLSTSANRDESAA